jgi:hypothetical protein
LIPKKGEEKIKIRVKKKKNKGSLNSSGMGALNHMTGPNTPSSSLSSPILKILNKEILSRSKQETIYTLSNPGPNTRANHIPKKNQLIEKEIELSMPPAAESIFLH